MSMLAERNILNKIIEQRYCRLGCSCDLISRCSFLCDRLLKSKNLYARLYARLQVNSKIKLTERELFTLQFEFPSLTKYIKENL